MSNTVKVEVLFDDEIYSGKWSEGGSKYFAAGDVIDIPEATAERLIADRKVRKSRAKPKAKTAADPAEGES